MSEDCLALLSRFAAFAVLSGEFDANNGLLRELSKTPKSSLSMYIYISTITHKKITELIPKQFRFGNSSTQITEYNSKNNSVRDLVILCSHFLPRPSNSRNNRFGNLRAGITEINSKIIKFGSVIVLCAMVNLYLYRNIERVVFEGPDLADDPRNLDSQTRLLRVSDLFHRHLGNGVCKHGASYSQHSFPDLLDFHGFLGFERNSMFFEHFPFFLRILAAKQ